MNETTPVFPYAGQTVRLFKGGLAAGTVLVVSVADDGSSAQVRYADSVENTFVRDPRGDSDRYVQDPGEDNDIGWSLNPCFYAVG